MERQAERRTARAGRRRRTRRPVTKDANLQYEQKLTALPLAVVILRAATNDIDDIRPLIPQLLAALANLPPRAITIVP